MSEMIDRFKNGAEKLRHGLATSKDVGSFVVSGAIELVAQDPKMNELARNKGLQNEQRSLATVDTLESRVLRGKDIISRARGDDEKINAYSLSQDEIEFLRKTAEGVGFLKMGVMPHEVEYLLAVHDIDNSRS